MFKSAQEHWHTACKECSKVPGTWDRMPSTGKKEQWMANFQETKILSVRSKLLQKFTSMHYKALHAHNAFWENHYVV